MSSPNLPEESPEDSPYRAPAADINSPKRPVSNWSKAGFFIGIGLFFASLALAFTIGPFAIVLGLIAAVLFGLYNRKFGFVSGFLAGILICIGLTFLTVIVICGQMGSGTGR